MQKAVDLSLLAVNFKLKCLSKVAFPYAKWNIYLVDIHGFVPAVYMYVYSGHLSNKKNRNKGLQHWSMSHFQTIQNFKTLVLFSHIFIFLAQKSLLNTFYVDVALWNCRCPVFEISKYHHKIK